MQVVCIWVHCIRADALTLRINYNTLGSKVGSESDIYYILLFNFVESHDGINSKTIMQNNCLQPTDCII